MITNTVPINSPEGEAILRKTWDEFWAKPGNQIPQETFVWGEKITTQQKTPPMSGAS